MDMEIAEIGDKQLTSRSSSQLSLSESFKEMDLETSDSYMLQKILPEEASKTAF